MSNEDIKTIDSVDTKSISLDFDTVDEANEFLDEMKTFISNIDYAKWRKVGWEILRSAFASTIGSTVILNILQNFDPNLFSDKTGLSKWIVGAIFVFIVTFIKAVGKAIRTYAENQDKSSAIHKLPL